MEITKLETSSTIRCNLYEGDITTAVYKCEPHVVFSNECRMGDAIKFVFFGDGDRILPVVTKCKPEEAQGYVVTNPCLFMNANQVESFEGDVDKWVAGPRVKGHCRSSGISAPTEVCNFLKYSVPMYQSEDKLTNYTMTDNFNKGLDEMSG